MATTPTTTVKKPTKADRYNELLALDAVKANADLTAFVQHELELLTKKNGAERKPTPTQVQNATIGDAVVAAMQPNRLYTVSEIIKEIPACNGLSTQRVSPILSNLVDAQLVEKVTEKRKSLYRVNA